MNESNINSVWLFKTIWQRMDEFNKFKETSKVQTQQSNLDAQFNEMQNVYSSWLTATDPWTIKTTNNVTKMSEAAMRWKEYAQSKGKDRSSWTTPQVLTELKNSEPNFLSNFDMYMSDDSMDSTGFAMNMWWIKPEVQQEEMDAPDYEYQWNFLTEWFKPIINMSASLATKLDNKINSKGWYEVDEETAKLLEEQGISPYVAQNGWAFSQYLYEKYGRALTLDQNIKDEEIQYVSQHPELLDRFINNAETNLALWEWALDTAFSITAPWMKTLLMWIWETKRWWALLWAAWELIALWGNVINNVPWLSQWRDNLPDEDKHRFDAFVWNIATYLLLKWRAKKWEVKIEQSLNPRNIIRKFERMVEETPKANLMDIMKNVKSNVKSMIIDWKATPEKVNETAWKIVKGRNLKDQQKATNALSKTNIEDVTTYAELAKRIESAMNDIISKEDEIYKKDTTTYKPEQTRSTTEVENAWQKTTIENTPVEDAINLLKEMYEWDKLNEAALNNLIQKFETEWLTKWEINNLSRAIGSKSNSYNAKNELKKTKSAQDVERIRQAVKEFARWENEELKNLDKDYSDMKNTKDLVDKMSDEVLKAKENLANKNLLQKVSGLAWEIIDLVWGKNFIQKVLPKMFWDEKMSAITREKQLSNNLNKLNRLTNRLKTAVTEAEVASAVEEFNSAMEALPE